MKKLNILSKSILSLCLLLLSCEDHMSQMHSGQPVTVIEGNFVSALAQPSVSGATTQLVAQKVVTTLLGFGSVSGLGYQASSLLGPTIQVRSGENVQIKLINQLSEPTNVHWHGLKVPANLDGHPSSVVNSGSSFDYNFTVNQRAGCYWYHPHPDMVTGKQVFMGLAGLFMVRDAEEDALKLPSGLRELPLVIQDKRISAGAIPYNPSSSELMSGMMGQYVFVNGVYAPVHSVESAKYRYRILNGSNARIYNLALSNGASFNVIGNDGGLLERPEKLNRFLLGPGERADVIIDFGGMAVDSNVYLLSTTFSGGTAQGAQQFRIMKFKVTTIVSDTTIIPTTLSTLPRLTPSMVTKTRSFDIQNTTMHSASMMMHNINGKTYDVSRIDEVVDEGATEMWVFDNSKGEEPHPMHLHGVLFQVQSRAGGRGSLSALEGGWKDVVMCMPGEKVQVIVPFKGTTGTYMYHCHNLEHEDTGMMGQFNIR